MHGLKQLKWLWLSAFVVLLDQLSKYFAVTHLVYGQPKEILSFFNLTLAFNTGAAFSFLENAGGWQIYLFIAISAIIAGVFLVMLCMLKANQVWRALGISFIIGGAVGNLIDRVRLTYVVDFFDFHAKNWHYATFNVADIAVCIGAFFFIFSLLYRPSA